MLKKYFFFLVTISGIQFTIGQTLSSAPTLTFTSNTGISSDNIATDGEGGSVNISDIDIQIYNISNVNGTFVSPLSWENTGFYVAGSYTGLTANIGTGTKGMLIKSVSGAEFKLNQFQYLNWGESQAEAAVNTIKGYKNGIEVASSTFQGYNNPFLPNTIVLNSAFNDIDEVRFYISAGGYQGTQLYSNHSINAVQVSTPILSTNDFELNSKIQLYPNPSTGIFNISLEEDTLVEVHDMLGKVIYANKVKSGNNTIDISNYQSGMYLLQVETENGLVTKKLLKD